ncbi:MAG: GNAT family N-acetyltransferase, partial [Asticcacaulis sp.]
KRAQYRQCGLHDVFGCGWTLDLLHGLAAFDDEAYGLRAAVYRHEGRVVAAEIGLLGEGEVHLWFPAYDPAYYRYSIGILLVVAMIRHLAPQGIRRFDFGTGGEEYKDPLTVRAETVGEGSLTYRPRPFMQLLDTAARVMPAGERVERARLSLRRRLSLINATETTPSGWARAVIGLTRRAAMRLRAVPKQA